MAYIRTKEKKGKTYYYLVESVRIDCKPRQKVLKYIGPTEKVKQIMELLNEKFKTK